MTTLKVLSVERNAESGLDSPSMPAFQVKGVWEGKPFTYNVAMELEGRDVEWEHVDGVEPGMEALLYDTDATVFTAIYESEAYKQARAAYEDARD